MECIEQGVVTRLIDGRWAVVSATRSEACATCSSKGTCSALGGESSSTQVRARNDVGARPGDRVSVGMAGSSIVGAAALLYFFPAVAIIGGAVAGQHVGAARGTNPDAGAALGAAAALAISLILIGFIGRRLARRREFIPRITAILVHGNPEEPGAGPA